MPDPLRLAGRGALRREREDRPGVRRRQRGARGRRMPRRACELLAGVGLARERLEVVLDEVFSSVQVNIRVSASLLGPMP